MKKILVLAILTLQFAQISAQSIQKLSAEEAHAFLDTIDTDTMLIIDGRSYEMYRSGHLKNAININAYKENLEELLTSAVICEHLFIYCTKSSRSDTIINTLSRMGYKGDIIQMNDGISAWKENEFEVIVVEPNEEKGNKEDDNNDPPKTTGQK